MAVLIDNRQDILRILPEAIKRAAQTALSALDCPEGELSIVVVDDAQIAELNRRYLHRQGPTNVIAFSMREGAFSDVAPFLLGDVVISVETAQREALSAGMRIEERFKHLLIHGLLHLFGFDHETGKEDARAMDAKSEELISLIGTLSCIVSDAADQSSRRKR